MKRRGSLLAKIYLSTAVAVTTLFAVAGWFFERQASRALHDSVEQEVRASLGIVLASWQARAERLSTASALLASMSDVRKAFGTRDRATIRDSAAEFWTRVRAADAAFVVAGPGGTVLASIGGRTPSPLAVDQQLPASLLDPARRKFPEQSDAFAIWDGGVWQVLATPVYVESGAEPDLLSILVAAYPVTIETLKELKQRSGGSDFLLRLGTQTALSTMQETPSPKEFAILPTRLEDGLGNTVAELWAVRSFAAVESRIATLRTTVLVAWLAAMTIGLVLSYLLARRIVRPIQDEQMRSVQIAAVGRLAASIAHDLRNPLAAIVGGSEMLSDFDLPPEQMRQTGQHIHKAAKRMEQLLSEVGQVARSEPGQKTRCALAELVNGAVESQQEKAGSRKVTIRQNIDAGLIANCQKSRVERVLVNLIANAIEVLPEGGEITIEAARAGSALLIDVGDNGPGIPKEIRAKLFEPFVTAGKKNGLGLGLALARQAMIDQGGDLALVPGEKGARFRLTLPGAPS